MEDKTLSSGFKFQSENFRVVTSPVRQLFSRHILVDKHGFHGQTSWSSWTKIQVLMESNVLMALPNKVFSKATPTASNMDLGMDF